METNVIKVEPGTVVKYNHQENVLAIKEDINFIRRKNAEYAIKIGQKLMLMKSNVEHGKWYDSLDDIGITHRAAERMMKVAETFGDRPELLEGMALNKAYLMSTMPEENLIQLKEDEILMASDGTAYTLGEIKEMTSMELEKQLANLQNQKNKEIREWREKAIEAREEMKSMEKDHAAQVELTRKIMMDASKALTEEVDKRDLLIKNKNEELDKIKLELQDKKEELLAGQEAFKAIEDATRVLQFDIVAKLNSIRLVRDYELKAQFYGYIQLVRSYMTMLEERAHAYFGPMPLVYPEDVYVDEELNKD